MTLPDEKYRALQKGKKLLEELCDPGKTPRVPGIVRQRARDVLRHYPTDNEFEKITVVNPPLINGDEWFKTYGDVANTGS